MPRPLASGATASRLRLFVIALSIASVLGAPSARAEDPPQPGVQPKEVVRKVSGPAAAMAVSPDGRWLAVADSIANEVVLFSTQDDRRTTVARGKSDGFFWRNLLFTDDSGFLVAEPYSDDSGTCIVHVIDVGGAKESFTIDCSARQQDDKRGILEVIPGGRASQIVVRRFRVTETWDARTAERVSTESSDFDYEGLHVYRTHEPGTVLEDRGEAIVLVGAGPRSRARWQIDAAREVAAPKGRKPDEAIHDRHVRVVGVTSDGRFLVLHWDWKRGQKGNDALGAVRQVAVHSMKDGKVVWARETSASPRTIAAGHGVIAIGREDVVEFLDAANGKPRGSVATSPGAAVIVPASDGRAFWVNTLNGGIVSVAPPAPPK